MTTAADLAGAPWTACTITTTDSLAATRRLHRSVDAHCAGVPLVVLVADDLDRDASGADEPFLVVGSEDVGLDDARLRTMAMLYEVSELTHVLRPWLVEHLLDAGSTTVVVLDDSAVLGAPLDPLVAAVAGHALALAARTDIELVNPFVVGGETTIGRGAYDAGAIAFARPASDLLLRWRDLASRGLSHGVGNGPTAEERLLAVVPALVDAAVVHGVGDMWHVPSIPDEGSASSRFERLSDGTAIDRRMRVLYREALNEHLESAAAEPPNPFGPEGDDAFWAWLAEPSVPLVSPRVPRYLARIWVESDALRREFPDLGFETCDAFQRWVRSNASSVVPARLLPSEEALDRVQAGRRAQRPRGEQPTGVNVVGYLGAVLGLGEAGRVVEQALELGGCATTVVENRATRSPRDDRDVATSPPEDAPYDVNLLVVSAEATADVAMQFGPSFFAGRRTIGLWFWEVDPYDVPPAALDLVDEIWAPSAFVCHALRGVSTPIVQVPIPVPIPAVPDDVDRASLGLPADAFLFGFTYDFLSVANRKNPYGVLDAFCRAFSESDGVALVLKSINGRFDRAGLERLLREAEARSDVIVIDEHFPGWKQAALIGTCDAYVSLHRSEGFGLTMAEAMALGKPVIATGYSGNLDFMNDDVAYLVGYEEQAVGEGADPYPVDARWADPDLDHAASLMRRVFDERDEARAVGERAARHIRANHSLESVAPTLARLAAETNERLDGAPATWRNHFMAGWRARARPDLHRYYEYDWLPDGTPVDDTMQRTFNDALDRARTGEDVVAPSPDVPGGADAVLAWLNQPTVPRRRPVVSRYLRRYWADHPEVQARFANLDDRRDARAYLDWVRARWRDETDIWWRLVPDSGLSRRPESSA